MRIIKNLDYDAFRMRDSEIISRIRIISYYRVGYSQASSPRPVKLYRLVPGLVDRGRVIHPENVRIPKHPVQRHLCLRQGEMTGLGT